MTAKTRYNWDTPFIRTRDSYRVLCLFLKQNHRVDMSETLGLLRSHPHSLHNDSSKDYSSVVDYLPDFYRIYCTATHPDARKKAFSLLKMLVSENPELPFPSVIYDSPSGFISSNHLQILDLPFEKFHSSTHNLAHILLSARFDSFGRLENIFQIMAFHPEVLESFLTLHTFLLESDSLMPFSERYFLAILAAAEMRCTYLVYLFAAQFIAHGGDNVWLIYPTEALPKLRQFVAINALLAHEPWKLNASHIADLALSVSELAFTICLLTHVHALACFVFGTGVNPEIDQPGGCSFTLVKSPSPPLDAVAGEPPFLRKQSANGVAAMKNGGGAATEFVQKLLPFSADDSQDELDCDRVQELFRQVIKDNRDLDDRNPAEWLAGLDEQLEDSDAHPAMQQFLALKPSQGYSSFCGTPFHFQTFPWDNDGQAEINELYQDLGTHIGNNFMKTFNLTYHSVNELKNVDTSVYRRTVKNTVQSFFGVCHDDFDYERVGLLVSEKERIFLKRCTTRPFEIGTRFEQYSYLNLLPAFKPSEVVHVLLMAMEARRQVCLLYAIRAISEYRLMH